MPKSHYAFASALACAFFALSVGGRLWWHHQSIDQPSAGIVRPTQPIVGEAQRLLHGQCMCINRATANELRLLPRIGPALAGRIVEDRHAKGAFPHLDALTRVPGIGPKTLAQVRPWLCDASRSHREKGC